MDTSSQIKNFILDNLSKHKKDIINTSIQKFGISRQAMLKHMRTLIEEKEVIAHGKTKDRYYEHRPKINFNKEIKLESSFSTDNTVLEFVLPNLGHLRSNVIEIIQFSMTALLNNVIIHSNAQKLYFKLYHTHDDFHVVVTDNGNGIFKNIASALDLESKRIAAIELLKGRITTDPDNYSGEELNAILNIFDNIKIESNGVALTVDNLNKEMYTEPSLNEYGTRIHLKINPKTKKSCQEVFKKIYNSNLDEVSIPMCLLKKSKLDQLNSRSQAKRGLHNIKGLNFVYLDFKGVEIIGPAFADEIIRQIKKVSKSIKVNWVNSNEVVEIMMSRAVSRFK